MGWSVPALPLSSELMNHLDVKREYLLDLLVRKYVGRQTNDLRLIELAYCSIADVLWTEGAWRAREQAKFIRDCLP